MPETTPMANTIEKILTQAAPQVGSLPGLLASLLAQPAQQQHEMQHDQVEPAFHRIGHAVIGIERRRARLRHDRAIKRGDDAGLGSTSKPRQDHGDRPVP